MANEEDDEDRLAIEAQAREMGWVPEEEWDPAKSKSGKKPARFMSAKEYIEFTEGNVSVMRETNRRLREEGVSTRAELRATRDKLDDIGKLVENLYRQNKTIGQREYDRGKQEAEAAKHAAIEAGDHAAVAQADETLRKLEDIKPTEEEQPPEREKANGKHPPGADPVVKAWVDSHPEFLSNTVLNAAMEREHRALEASRPSMEARARLDLAWANVRKRLPGEFEADSGEQDEPDEPDEPEERREAPARDRRREPASVGASRRGNGRENRKTFDRLPKSLQDDYHRHANWMRENSRGRKGGEVNYTKEEFMAGLPDDSWS